MDANAQPTWVINTNSMVVIIQEIKKEPIAEAKALIRENISNLPFLVTPQEKTSLSSRMSVPQPPLRPNGVSGSLDRSPSETEIARQTDLVVLGKKERETRAVFHDYGDGKGRLMISSASFRSSSQSDGLVLSTHVYVPVAPFNLSDSRLRKRRQRGD